jgi:hypothetical protein
VPAQIDFAVQDTATARVADAQILARHVTLDQPAGATKRSQSVVLPDGSAMVVWTEGSIEWGRRAMAQAFEGDGSPRGAPVVVSSPTMDVIGQPLGLVVDDHRVVATFYAAEGDEFELVAVSIDGL